MANPILQQAVRRKLRESHLQGLKDGSIKMPQVIRKPWWKVWIWPRRGATAYEWQIGRVYGRVTHLYGGDWKHWWQPSRWSIHWERVRADH